MNDRVVKTHTVSTYITPLGFHRYASKYLRAAEGFEKTDTYSPVPYFLYCRSLELALKAFLLANGQPMESLKRVSHNLVAALEEANRLGLFAAVTVSSLHREELKKANCYYPTKAGKGFEYFEVVRAVKQHPDLPSLDVLSDFASALVCKLEKMCIDAAHVNQRI